MWGANRTDTVRDDAVGAAVAAASEMAARSNTDFVVVENIVFASDFGIFAFAP